MSWLFVFNTLYIYDNKMIGVGSWLAMVERFFFGFVLTCPNRIQLMVSKIAKS